VSERNDAHPRAGAPGFSILSIRARRLLVTAAAAVMMIAACGDDGGAASPPTTTSGPVDTTGATTIEVSYTGGNIIGGGKRSAPLGKPVVIKVTTDITDEIHLHGYDEKADAGPGMVATLSFVADKPGIFEVELEKKGLKLFELEVK
jgi:heme/copper-type cytochrome/quinol oxidase subunit 2